MIRLISFLVLVAGVVFSDRFASDAEAGVRGKTYSGLIYTADMGTSPPLFGRMAFDNGNGFQFDLGAFVVGIVDQYYGLTLEQDIGLVSFVGFSGIDFAGGDLSGSGVQVLGVMVGNVNIKLPGEDTGRSGVFGFVRELNPPDTKLVRAAVAERDGRRLRPTM